MPLSPAVIRYSPSRDNNMHYIRMSERIINLSINDTNLSATYANIHLKIIVVRLVTQQATVDGERGNIALIIIDNDEALA